MKAGKCNGYYMLETNKYGQRIIKYLSNLSSQRTMLYVAIGGVSVCLVLIILGLIYPTGKPTNNQTIADKPDSIVETYAGITSDYTANQAIDFVQSAIQSNDIENPRCDTEQGEFKAFFSHRKYWKISFACPPDPSEGIHVYTEYTYTFNEWDKSVIDSTDN